MSIQFKSITELKEMLDNKSISSEELTKETFKLAEDLKELNCFITMNQDAAIQKSQEYNCIIVLKSHQTVITNGHRTFVNTTGNVGLAKGGSGDALTGIILAFLAQSYEPIQAAKLAVFLHGLSADITLQTQSEESMLITDVIENLGKAFQIIHSKINE